MERDTVCALQGCLKIQVCIASGSRSAKLFGETSAECATKLGSDGVVEEGRRCMAAERESSERRSKSGRTCVSSNLLFPVPHALESGD